jgi:hypothetical protein
MRRCGTARAVPECDRSARHRALKRIWPALSGRQEEALVSEFQHARAITVGLGTPEIRSTGAEPRLVPAELRDHDR